MFEVETLKYDTLATVSRCGMVWFSEYTVTSKMMVTHYLKSLRTVIFEDLDEDNTISSGQVLVKSLSTQSHMAELLGQLFENDNFIPETLMQARK